MIMKLSSSIILSIVSISLWTQDKNAVSCFTIDPPKQANQQPSKWSVSTTQRNAVSKSTTLQTPISRSSRSSSSRSSSASKIDYGNDISIGMYEQDGWNCTYLYKPASPGYETDAPIVLIHPVGVGISSWFWTRVMKEYSSGPALYAPDLIGCGLEHGASPWKPLEKGMFFPLSWVQGIETFLQTIVLPPKTSSSSTWRSIFGRTTTTGCTIVVQGGLAPVGVMLAARNTRDVISKLVLTSPPTYKDMTTAIPNQELEWNYQWLRNPIVGTVAFSILESQLIVKFFSDLFLFQSKCDEDWLASVKTGSVDPQSRTPIEAFNAGLLQHRSYEEELTTILEQPTYIVQGESDKRQVDRLPYEQYMKQCQTVTLPNACNVIPWENPKDIVNLLQSLQQS